MYIVKPELQDPIFFPNFLKKPSEDLKNHLIKVLFWKLIVWVGQENHSVRKKGYRMKLANL